MSSQRAKGQVPLLYICDLKKRLGMRIRTSTNNSAALGVEKLLNLLASSAYQLTHSALVCMHLYLPHDSARYE
jgi:hypothetical protein